MLTSAPSESQLRLLSVLGMRDDLDKVELQNIVPAFFDNYNANILDAVSCVAMCLIPYGFAPMLAYTFAAGSGVAVDFIMNLIVLFSFHGIGLGIAMLVAMITGWGRTFVEKKAK